jgi:minichromosome maintenance protein 10
MSMSAVSKKKSAYDPAHQWGLKPEESGGVGATYIVSGHVISGSSDTKSMYVSETIGREAQAKASRVSAREADKALKALLEKDKDGMRAVLKAREVGVKEKEDSDQKKSKPLNATEGKDGNADNRPRRQQKNAYSADVIKKLGFDPTAKAGNKGDDAVKKKVRT